MTRQVFVQRMTSTALMSGFFASVAAAACFFQDQPARTSVDQTPVFMRAKLASAQKVLEGLVAEDFALITGGAAEMHQLSHARRWPQSTDKVYGHLNAAFRNHCRKLAEQSEAKDLSAAHYTYLQLTTSCIDCHNYVRKNFRIQPSDDHRGPIQLIPTEWDSSTNRPNMRASAPPHSATDR